MADRDPADLLRENVYLKLRNAQLQSDILDLSAEVERLRRIQDRLHIRSMVQKPDIPTGGESCSSEKHVSQTASTRWEVTQVQGPASMIMEDEVMAEYAITRVPSDYFHVGGYRYTSLQDAAAQAKRQRSIV